MILASHGIIGSSIVQEPIFVFSIKTDNAGVSTSSQFRMPLTTSTGLNFDVNWGDGSAIENITVHTNAIHTYATSGTYTIRVTGSILGWQFANGGDKLKMLNVASWGALKISVDSGFHGCTNMTSTAIDVPVITSTSLASYFEATKFNGELNYWDVSGVSDFARMFRLASFFNKPLDLWNMSSATNLRTMFAGTSFNQNINSWNVSNVTNFINTFAYCNFNQPLDLWVLNTSQPIDMTGMFENNPSFNRDISGWITTQVTSMRYMFVGASAFNQPIGIWDVSNVTLMEVMFQSATAFNQDIGSWNVSNVTNFTSFMANKTAANYSAANLDSIYNGWSSRPVQPNLSISFGSIKYTAAGQAGKDILDFAPNNWTIIDGGI